MELGVHIGQQNTSMDVLRSTWKKFDTAKIDWISVWDHLYEAPPAGGTIDHFEAVSTLGALCADTSHARIGCLVFYVGYRNPALIAKTAATLDHISNGRFELGLGAGWHEWEAQAFGYDFPSLKDRFVMLGEALELVRNMLDSGPTGRTTFDGEWYRTDDVSNLPPPVQASLPMWVGGIGEKKTLPLAAKWADGWNAPYISASEFGRLCGVLDAACEDVGRDPSTISRTINLQFVVGSDEADAARALAETEVFWGPMWPRVKEGALIGTPDQIIEQIAAYGDAGADGVNIALRAPWNDEAIDAYLETVLPHFRPQ